MARSLGVRKDPLPGTHHKTIYRPFQQGRRAIRQTDPSRPPRLRPGPGRAGRGNGRDRGGKPIRVSLFSFRQNALTPISPDDAARRRRAARDTRFAAQFDSARLGLPLGEDRACETVPEARYRRCGTRLKGHASRQCMRAVSACDAEPQRMTAPGPGIWRARSSSISVTDKSLAGNA
jgi:hypothetical protein